MLFHSTRGQSPAIDIRGVALAGLAPDGGLYLPREWPRFSAEEIAAMKGDNYRQIAFKVLRPFLQSAMPDDVLKDIIEKSYAVFDDPDVTPLKPLGDERYLLELSLGPTLAFKDVALQFLGHTFEYLLKSEGKRLTVIGATSGDTGSAAIAALANRANIDLFILYPEKGPSEIQRKQMTCVDASNVHALAVKGSFDDCQAMVKKLFADAPLRTELNLTTVNSINLLRILAQVVYYFYAATRVAPAKPTFVVPTGNFGDVFAGYAALKCGLPVAKLVVASNSNDILTRFFETGTMSVSGVQLTLSPSMDIQVSSNFERLLFDIFGDEAELVRRAMAELKDKGSFTVTQQQLAIARHLFAAGRASDEETLATIARTFKSCGALIDPHTAVGVKVADDMAATLAKPVICLATAHAAKFPDAVRQATGREAPLPPATAALIAKPERTQLIPADTQIFIDFIRKHKQA